MPRGKKSRKNKFINKKPFKNQNLHKQNKNSKQAILAINKGFIPESELYKNYSAEEIMFVINVLSVREKHHTYKDGKIFLENYYKEEDIDTILFHARESKIIE